MKEKYIIENIYFFMKKYNLNVNQLGRKTNLTGVTIKNILEGKTEDPYLISIIKIANAFEISVSDFLYKNLEKEEIENE